MSGKLVDRHCECGHLVKWYVESDEPGFLDRELGLEPPYVRLEEDVVERPCVHRNGTVIQFCPSCDRKVGMWGCGPAGGMECDCWDADMSTPPRLPLCTVCKCPLNREGDCSNCPESDAPAGVSPIGGTTNE